MHSIPIVHPGAVGIGLFNLEVGVNTWVLVIIYGISTWGAGGFTKADFPSEESCYKALESMKIKGVHQQGGEDDEQVIAYCKPKDNE
ncbi:MAG: hypothetical protein KUG81_09945 [Gammaproteobacteria bacterium]|nr:hypothetical protein [Gammaproteobacteria bacterium]